MPQTGGPINAPKQRKPKVKVPEIPIRKVHKAAAIMKKRTYKAR